MVVRIGLMAFLLVSIAGCSAVCGPRGWTGQARDIVRDDFGPRQQFLHYQWFKDASAVLDKRTADIKVYDARIQSLVNSYEGVPRSEWSREDREQWSIWLSELAGIKAAYNSLAAEYNANMAKVNWRYANVGQVPEGGQPLPREYRTYIEE